MHSALDALHELKEGNARFVSGYQRRGTLLSQARRKELCDGQAPFAVILGCSDSRVPVELVFDQGLGDLFVIRVAGNIVAPSGIGSIEFATAMFGTRLVVVMGHTQCGAVAATLAEMQRPTDLQSRNLQFIVNRIKPNIEGLTHINEAVHANVHASVLALRHGSEVLENMVQNEELLIVGAEYSLETGKVEFFDEPAG